MKLSQNYLNGTNVAVPVRELFTSTTVKQFYRFLPVYHGTNCPPYSLLPSFSAGAVNCPHKYSNTTIDQDWSSCHCYDLSVQGAHRVMNCSSQLTKPL